MHGTILLMTRHGGHFPNSAIPSSAFSYSVFRTPRFTNSHCKGAIEQRVVGLTVHNEMLIIVVAQCSVCVCVYMMDSVFGIGVSFILLSPTVLQPLETTEVYHNRLLVMYRLSL